MTHLLLLALALVVPGAPQTPSVAVSGKWAVSSSISGNDSQQTCTFAQKDNDLTGSCEGDAGSVPITGKIDGKKVTWQFDTEYEGQKLTIYYGGTVESPEKLVGRVDVSPMGVSGEFSASKAK